ncbi:uncharacterized protein LOC126425248 [Schistocerca serialis cubense]|uniref:uncharacterized protein LOC126425248 n=1 Tax=Schistocerca serialis cubense TaxID=2023355 RepID=UPI00214E4020|nr:uncharacterized protein LOC126425248 [Schistocerca serialis cubense]
MCFVTTTGSRTSSVFKVRTSTRDWIGLFKKGWSKPEELIVFEWATGHASEETLPRRAVTFCSKDFRSRINPNDQYQFAYVSKLHQILGRSQFFLFITDVIHQIHQNYLSENVSSVETDDEDSDWLHVSQVHSQATKRVNAVSGLAGALPHLDVPQNCTPAPKKNSTCNWSTGHVTINHHLSGNVSPSKTNALRVAPAPSVVDTLAHPDLPPNFNRKKSADKKCPTCNCPSDYVIANNRLTEKVVSQAELIRSLESKLTALQSELELCHVSQQQLKIKADMACREKENYCSFIGQFLESLKRKGQLKVVDSEGNTIMVKNVSPQVKDGQTTARNQSYASSVGAPQCPFVSAAGDTQQRRRQELAAELKQVCRKYCEETDSVQIGSTDMSAEDTAGQLHSSAAVNDANKELSQDDPAQLTCADASGEQLENGKELVSNQPTEDEVSNELEELFRHTSLS